MTSSPQIAQTNEPIDYEKIRQMIAEEVSNALNQNGRNNKREAK